MGNPRRTWLLVVVALLAAGAGAGAQAPVPTGSIPRGFSSQLLVAQLSLYLPEEATRGMYRGFGGRGAGSAGQGAVQDGQGSGSGGRQFPLQFTRDAKLYLTRAQIGALLPVLSSLRDSPLPTPTRAKQVQGAVDGILTDAQKAEWGEFQKKMQDLAAQFRQQRMGANGQGEAGVTRGGDGTAQSGSPGGTGGPGGTPQATLLQRRQRQLDAFIKVLQDRLNAVGA